MSPALEAATIAKLEAEATYALAQARGEHAKALESEHDARLSAITLRIAEEIEASRLQADETHRVYRFTTPVDANTAQHCLQTLARWHRLDPACDIEIIFTSPGGSVVHGMALFDQIKRLSIHGGGSHHVTTGIAGWAASMAGILLQAGDTRWMGSESTLMIHEISAQTGGKIGDIKDDTKWFEMLCERIAHLFVQRSGGKCSAAKFRKGWERTDWFLLSSEALALGFIDEVR